MALSQGTMPEAFWVEEAPMSSTPCRDFWMHTCSAQTEFPCSISTRIAPSVRASRSRANSQTPERCTSVCSLRKIGRAHVRTPVTNAQLVSPPTHVQQKHTTQQK